MTPMQKIAMGLVIVFGVANFPAHPHPAWQFYDGLADPVGWVLVLLGMLQFVRLHPGLDTLRWLTILAAVVSVPIWFPQLNHHLNDSGDWAVQLPQNLTCFMLAREIGRLGSYQQPRDQYVAKRFGLLSWGFAIVTVMPVIVEGGGIDRLAVAADGVKFAVVIALVFYLFMVHRREWLGGPGPKDYTGKVDRARERARERAEMRADWAESRAKAAEDRQRARDARAARRPPPRGERPPK